MEAAWEEEEGRGRNFLNRKFEAAGMNRWGCRSDETADFHIKIDYYRDSTIFPR